MSASKPDRDSVAARPAPAMDAAEEWTDKWAEAQRAAAVLAVQAQSLGGAVLRAGAGPVRDAWIDMLRALLPVDAPMRRVPVHVQDERLLGGLDLGASLQSGRAVAQRGLLAEADGGIVVLAMAERTSAATAARLAAVLDAGEVVLAREGVTQTHASRIGVLALDEGDADERPPPALTDRLALWLDLAAISPGAMAACNVEPYDADEVRSARLHLPAVRISDTLSSALCAAAVAMGIESMRAPLLAIRVARVLAALQSHDDVAEQDAALAARWVLGPRARMLPMAEAPNQPQPPDAEPQDASGPPGDPSTAGPAERPDAEPGLPPDDPDASDPGTLAALEESVLAAARATMPPHLLETFALAGADRLPATASAGAGQARAHRHRGAPIGVRRGDPRNGQRLNLLATLRAAAPWQRLRAQAVPCPAPSLAPSPDPPSGAEHRVHIRSEDFRVTHYRQRAQTTVIFVVDASGSAALHRLAEAKGAVELLLADCYARRDSVAVLAFRGASAELLMPPTRSLVRARRSLAGLPGGGGTPLASAIDAATLLAEQLRRNGQTPLTVLLTDGRANIARDGSPGRERAEVQALHASQRMRAGGLAAMLLDTSPRPNPQARRVADAMGAMYLALPQADAVGVSAAVRAAKQAGSDSGRTRTPAAPRRAVA